jgi:glycosyltransferase involved in cell wall biosynthesis
MSTSPKSGLSAILIAKNEERDLPGALQSLEGLAQEIVVVVGEGTTDRTAEIAKAAGATVKWREFDHYAGQKQAALDLATREWVLSIDADERVSPELADSIRAIVRGGSPAAAFDLDFEVHFLGRVLRWGGLGHERHLRLFKRAQGRFVGGLLHEGIEIDGKTARTKGKMIHEPYKDLGEYLEKCERYTTLAAKKRFETGRRANVLHHLILPLEFFRRAILRLGILDGNPGLIWAGLSAFHSWLKYVKLMEIQRKNRK